jgi:hypothetical protein
VLTKISEIMAAVNVGDLKLATVRLDIGWRPPFSKLLVAECPYCKSVNNHGIARGEIESRFLLPRCCDGCGKDYCGDIDDPHGLQVDGV